VLGDLRSGLLSATVSLNLMTIVADSVERAVLFVQQGQQLVALGAFGATATGKPLAGITRGLNLRLEAASALSRCIAEGHALTLDYESGDLPPELALILDRPRSGQGVFFPVLGARRAIGLIYADNGRRAAGVQDVELMELATAQVGLAFENELLRRQLERLDRVVA
jgi:GAF domain-containing protein